MTVALRVSTPEVVLPGPPELEISPSFRQPLELHPVERMIRLTDVEHECAHGHLPLDRNPSCDCWTRARTAALLGQLPLDDGCAGLDRAAALDLPIPVPRQADLELAGDEHLDVAAMHEWYLGDERTIPLTAAKFGVPRARLVELFAAHELPLKEQTLGRLERTFSIVSQYPTTQEVAVQTSTNGHGPTAAPTVEDIHAWYMAEADRTLADVCAEYDLSSYAVKAQFEKAGLSCKPRGGKRASTPSPSPSPDAPPAIEIQAPNPETAIKGIDAAVIALDLERNRLAEQLRKVEDALDTVRALAA